jgi:hypothetical protein
MAAGGDSTLKQPGLIGLMKSREIDETNFRSVIFNDFIWHFACYSIRLIWMQQKRPELFEIIEDSMIT